MDVITSPSNLAVRAARRFARPSARARADGRFPLEGPEGIRAALDAGHVPERLLATERAAARHAGLVNSGLGQRGAQVTLVAEPVLSALAATTTLRGWWRQAERPGPGRPSRRPRPGLRAGRGPRPRQRRHRATGGRRLRRRRRGHDQGSVDLQSPAPGPPPAACSTCRWPPGRPGRSWPPPPRARPAPGRGRPARRRHRRPGPLGEPVALVLGNEAHGLPAEIAAGLDLVVRPPRAGPRA